jgi:hypothetical protein
MKKRNVKTVTIPEREYKKLFREHLVLKMLTEAINETRVEDELARMLKHANIQSNL